VGRIKSKVGQWGRYLIGAFWPFHILWWGVIKIPEYQEKHHSNF